MLLHPVLAADVLVDEVDAVAGVRRAGLHVTADYNYLVRILADHKTCWKVEGGRGYIFFR